jgi:hypothetical protein
VARGLYVVNQLPPVDITNRPSVASFTTFQDVYGAPQKIIPQQQLEVGFSLELEAWGYFSTTGTPTLSLGFWFNGAALAAPTTILAQTAAITTGSGAALWPWHLHWEGALQAANTGAAGGTWDGMGEYGLGTSLTAWATGPFPVTDALRTVTADVSGARAIGVGAAFSAAAAGNLVVVKKFIAKANS